MCLRIENTLFRRTKCEAQENWQDGLQLLAREEEKKREEEQVSFSLERDLLSNCRFYLDRIEEGRPTRVDARSTTSLVFNSS